MSASWYTALEHVERCQERTLHTPWVSSLNHDGIQQLHIPSWSPGKEPRPCFTQTHQWAESVCSRPLGASEEEGQDGNWNPIYLARLTRTFCPSLSGVPLSPSSVRSPSSKSCKSYTEIKKGGGIKKKFENVFYYYLKLLALVLHTSIWSTCMHAQLLRGFWLFVTP